MRSALACVLLVALACAALAAPRPAGPAVDRRDFDLVWTRRPVRFIGLGDSVTAGFTSSGHHAYFDLLTDNAPDENPDIAGISLQGVFPSLRVENHAASATNSYVHLRQARALAGSPPDTLGWVVITSGGNDLVYRYMNGPGDGAMRGATLEQARPWIASYGRRLDQLVDIIQSKFPGGCEIFIATIYDPTDGVGDIEKSIPALFRGLIGIGPWPHAEAVLGACNAEIARVCRRPHVHLVDVHGLLLGHGLHHADRTGPHYRPDDPTLWYMNDMQHPSERGHDAIRRAFLRAMAPLRRGLSVSRSSPSPHPEK